MTETPVIKHAVRYFALLHWFRSIQSVADITEARRHDNDLIDEHFQTCDFAVYETEGREDGTLEAYVILGSDSHIGPESINPIHAAPDVVEGELRETGNYRVTKDQRVHIQRAIDEGKAVRISYSALDNPGGCLFVEGEKEISSLEIKAADLAEFATGTHYFNDAQRALLTQLYRQPELQGALLQQKRKRGMRIELLSPAYVKEHAADVPIVLGCYLSADTRHARPWVELHDNFQFNTGQARGYESESRNRLRPRSLTGSDSVK